MQLGIGQGDIPKVGAIEHGRRFDRRRRGGIGGQKRPGKARVGQVGIGELRAVQLGIAQVDVPHTGFVEFRGR